MTPGTGLLEIPSGTPGLEIHLDNLHLVEDQEYIFIRAFSFQGWWNGTFSLTNSILDDVFSAANVEFIRIIGYTISYPLDNDYFDKVLIENVLIRSAFTNYGNARLFYTQYGKNVQIRDVKVQGGEFYYFAFMTSVTHYIVENLEFNNIFTSYKLFETADANLISFTGITVTNNSIVGGQVLESQINDEISVTNFLFENSISSSAFAIQFQDTPIVTMRNITFNNIKADGRAISLHDDDVVTITDMEVTDSVFTGYQVLYIWDAFSCNIDGVYMVNNIFNVTYPLFELECSISAEMSNLIFVDNCYREEIFKFVDMSDFILNGAYFNNLTSSKSSIRIIDLTYVVLNNITIIDVNTTGVSSSSVEFYCNGTVVGSSVSQMDISFVTSTRNVMQMKQCTSSFAVNELSINDSVAQSGLHISDGNTLSLASAMFLRNWFTEADIVCQNCLSCDFDSIFLVNGTSNKYTLLFQTSSQMSQAGLSVTIENSIITGYSNYDALAYFANTGSGQIEYRFQNVEFSNNQYTYTVNDSNSSVSNEGLITVSGINVKLEFLAVKFINNNGWESVIYCAEDSKCEIIIQESRFESNHMTKGTNALWFADGANSSLIALETQFRPNVAQSEVAFYDTSLNDSTIAMTFINCDFALFTREPTIIPSISPTDFPSASPTNDSNAPTTSPSTSPTSSPSESPTSSPTLAPTSSPSMSPTTVPSKSPTNTKCDETVQTYDTFVVCNFLIQFENNFDDATLHATNYCIDDIMSKFFKCWHVSDDSNSSITHIFLNDSGLEGSLLQNPTNLLFELTKFRWLEWLDLSNNQISGSVHFLQLSINSENSHYNNASHLTWLNLSANNFDKQSIDWYVFEFMQELEYIDLSNNQFTGQIDLSYFQYCENLKYFNVAYNLFTSIDIFDESISITYIKNLEYFIINNNLIRENFDVSYFTRNNNLITLKCNNNSLENSNLDMSDIPESLITFECGNNDFGEFIWDPLPYENYKLKIIDLSNTQMYGHLTMEFFDVEDGGYSELTSVDLSLNKNLNISINFQYLDAQTNMEYLNLLGTDAYGHVDFEYLSYVTNMTVIMSDEIYCVDSFCNGQSNGRIYGFTRENITCFGRDDCLDTCTCATAYTIGLESYIDSQLSHVLFVGLIGLVCGLCVVTIAGEMYAMGMINQKIRFCNKSDHFEFFGCLGFVFQIWDFFSDTLLCYDMYDHYYQESFNSPKKDDYFKYLALSMTFIFVPWIVNLLFLLQTKYIWQKEFASIDINRADAGNNPSSPRATIRANSLHQSTKTISHWLNKNSKILVLLCMLSGGLTASLKVVNSNLFGLKCFNMGLPRYKQDETARHRLWLTILLENIPQIIISTLYATQLARFDDTVLAALLSSISSVILATFSVLLEFPKHYYIYQIGIKLQISQNPKLRSSLRMTRTLSKVICHAFDRESGFFFVENVYFDGNNFVCFNIVSNEPISDNNINNTTIDVRRRRKIKNELSRNRKLQIECQHVLFSFVSHECVSLSLVGRRNNKSDHVQAGIGMENINSHSVQGDNISSHDQLEMSRANVNKSKDGDVDIMYDGAIMDDNSNVNMNNLDEKEWSSWTAQQLSTWIEIKLRNGIETAGYINADGMDMKIDDETEIKIENFMDKFNDQELTGPLLKLMKQNQELKSQFKSMMKNYGFGYWIIVSTAIDSLHDNAYGIKNDQNKELPVQPTIVDENTDQETQHLL